MTQGHKRFVFELTNTGNEITEGKTPVLHGCGTAREAVAEMATWALVREGANARLLGYRAGLYGATRFYPLVAIDELPWHIIQNERFAGMVPCPVCTSGECMLCDDDGQVSAEEQRRARFEREAGKAVA